MRCVLSYPGVMEHAQHAALSLLEAGALQCFVSNFVFDPDGRMSRTLSLFPNAIAEKLRRDFGRRGIEAELLPGTRTYPGWEILRTLAERGGAGPVWTDRIWDIAAQKFDAKVASRHVPGCDAVVGFEYTALKSFEAAGRLGKAKILHIPSLENRAFRAIELREKAEWPELRSRHDPYFDDKFARRLARRELEIALADVVVVNSSLTRRTYVDAGGDGAKIFTVPYGAPPPIAEPRVAPGQGEPLRVLWSGSFILRKGATYLLEAWRSLPAGPVARLDIYGSVGVPAGVMARLPAGVTLHGSVPRAQMLDAYAEADVLVFPTLSDGFGMVVTEALSRGLPVITTDQAGAADLIEHGKNGLVVPAGNARALADALRWCLDNRSKLADMRFAALATARRRQWSDYRRDHVLALDVGLRRAGFRPDFHIPALRQKTA
jgi:glycosyltransferase involved in cell wall biosynthesis